MKTIFKKISAAAMTLAVTASAFAVGVPTTITAGAAAPAAGDCDGTHSGWTEWTSGNLTADGNYFLDGAITLSVQTEITADVTLCLNGQTITAASGSRAFNIKSGSLTLCNCTGDGKIAGTPDPDNLIEHGGAIYVEKNCTFTMHGGTISGFSATEGGGVYLRQASTFIMDGGTISGNTAEHEGGGVYVSHVSGGDAGAQFEMSGGTISENEIIINANNPQPEYGGGGIYVAGTFTMSGGTISGNNGNVDDGHGGGVCIDPKGEFILSNGTISGNKAKYGGGVYVNKGKFNMSGGTIGGTNDGDANEASGGAGVCLGTGNGTFTMTNGTITGNISKNGGGIQMNGGTMTFDGPVTIKNNPSGNGPSESNVYLRADGKDSPTCFTITIGASFEPTDPIGVHVQPSIACQVDIDTALFSDGVQATNISQHFKADKDGQSIVYDDDKIKLHIEHDYGDWVITQAPGLETTGTAQRICKNDSSHTQEVELPPLTDTSVWTKDPDNDVYTSEYGTVIVPSSGFEVITPPITTDKDNNDNESSNSSESTNSSDSSDSVNSVDSSDGVDSSDSVNSVDSNDDVLGNDAENPTTGIAISLVPLATAIFALTMIVKRENKK